MHGLLHLLAGAKVDARAVAAGVISIIDVLKYSADARREAEVGRQKAVSFGYLVVQVIQKAVNYRKALGTFKNGTGPGKRFDSIIDADVGHIFGHRPVGNGGRGDLT